MSQNKKPRKNSREDDEPYVPAVQQSRRLAHTSSQLQQQHLQGSQAPPRPSVPQLTQYKLLDTHQLEQAQSKWDKEQQQQLDEAQTAVAYLENDAGRKRKQIQDLRSEVSRKQQRILSLEQCLQKYQKICSYMVSQAQVMNVHFSKALLSATDVFYEKFHACACMRHYSHQAVGSSHVGCAI